MAIACGTAVFGEYLSGHLIEKSLSVDNVIVWSMLFGTLTIPVQYQHRVLFWGIFGALTLRAISIALGTTLISRFSWVLLLFGAVPGIYRLQGAQTPSRRGSGWYDSGARSPAQAHAGDRGAARTAF